MGPSRANTLTIFGILLVFGLAGAHCQSVWEVFGRSAGAVGDTVISMDFSGGKLWVATTWVDPDSDEAPLEGGISLLNRETGNFTTYTPENGLAHVKVVDLMIDGKNVWCATPKGVCVFDTAKAAELDIFEMNEAFTTYTKKNGLFDDDVKSLTKDGDLIWAGTSNGLTWLNTKTGGNWSNIEGSDLPGKTVWSIAVDGNTVWLGTSSGLAKYNKETREIESVDLPTEGIGSEIVYVVKVDGESVWIGTRVGVHVLDTSSGSWTSYEDDVLPDLWINDILLEPETAYVCTLKGGVAVLNREKGKWKVIGTKKGLSNDEVNAIRPDEDVLWIATIRGLNKYYPAAAAKQLQRMLMYIGLGVAVVVAVVAARLTIFKPSAEQVARKKRDEEARTKRKERKRTGTPPWQLCNGVPKKDLCGRCKYNQVKSGKLHCSKYDIDLE